MAKSLYGRRILKWKTTANKIVFTLSGQWVGHSGYGWEFGTQKQRDNAKPDSSAKLLGISKEVLWGKTGRAGNLVDRKDVKRFKFLQDETNH